MFKPPERIALAALETRASLESWLGLVSALRERPGFWWLDSAMVESPMGQLSFAGSDPYLWLRSRGAHVEIEVMRNVRDGLALGFYRFESDPMEAARALLPRSDSVLYSTRSRKTLGHSEWHEVAGLSAGLDLPFLSGAVGYFGYEFWPHSSNPASSSRTETNCICRICHSPSSTACWPTITSPNASFSWGLVLATVAPRTRSRPEPKPSPHPAQTWMRSPDRSNPCSSRRRHRGVERRIRVPRSWARRPSRSNRPVMPVVMRSPSTSCSRRSRRETSIRRTSVSACSSRPTAIRGISIRLCVGITRRLSVRTYRFRMERRFSRVRPNAFFASTPQGRWRAGRSRARARAALRASRTTNSNRSSPGAKRTVRRTS